MPSRLCTLLLVLTCVSCGAQSSKAAEGAGDAAAPVAGLHLSLAGGAAQVPLVSSSPLAAAVAQALQSWGVTPGTRLHAVAASSADAPLLRNWVRHVRAGRIPHVALLALDADTVAVGEKLKLLTLDVATLVAHTPLTGRAALVPVLRAALAYGVDVLLSEPDVVWLRNPEMYLAVYDMLAADLLVASQCRYHFVARPSLDSRTGAKREPVESGVSLSVVGVKPSASGLAFVDAWLARLLGGNSSAAPGGKAGDQVLLDTFTEALWMGGAEAPRKVAWLSDVPGGSWDVAAREDLFPRYPPRVNDGTQVMPYKAVNDTLGVGILPVGLFANPHTWFAARLPVHYRLRPYSLHAGSLQAHHGAQLRLREAGLWLPGDGSAAPGDHNNATLRLRLRLPSDLASDALAAAGNRSAPWDKVALWRAHVALVTWQLQRVGEAAVLAGATGRSLELPDLFCGCDEADDMAADGQLEGAPAQGGCGQGETPPPPFPCSLAAGYKAAAVEAALADGGAPPPGFAFHIAAAPQLRRQQGVKLRLCRSAQEGACGDALGGRPGREDDRFDTEAELQGEQQAAAGVVVDVPVQSPLAALVAALGPHAQAPVVEVTLDAADALFAPASVPADTAAAVAGQLGRLARVALK